MFSYHPIVVGTWGEQWSKNPQYNSNKVIRIANNNKCMYYCTCLHLHSFKYDGTKLYNTTEVVHVKYYIDGVSFLDTYDYSYRISDLSINNKDRNVCTMYTSHTKKAMNLKLVTVV